jgi:hypothetical protein
MYVRRPAHRIRRAHGAARKLIIDLGKIWEAPRLQMSHPQRWESGAMPDRGELPCRNTAPELRGIIS